MAVAEPDMTLFNSSITELTTAATDAAIALVAAGCVLALNRHRARDPRRVQIWTWVFGLLVLASVLGALAHGLDLSATVRAWLWQPLYLTLGLIVAMFVVAALYDFRGEQAARRALLPMLALAFGFFAITQVGSVTFRAFLAYEALAMLAALGIYLQLARTGRLAGSGLIAAGILLNLVAAAIQASGAITLTLFVPFDHNGVFHLVQMVALVVLTIGLLRGMA
jgi:hypothetical protein